VWKEGGQRTGCWWGGGFFCKWQEPVGTVWVKKNPGWVPKVSLVTVVKTGGSEKRGVMVKNYGLARGWEGRGRELPLSCKKTRG